MRSEMEVPPNSLIVVKERGSPTTTTWGGGTLGGVGGRRMSQLARRRCPRSRPQQQCPAPWGTCSSYHQGNSLFLVSLVFEGEAMEEFVNSAWRGQRTSEEREPFGREERTTERANFAPPQQEVFSGRK